MPEERSSESRPPSALVFIAPSLPTPMLKRPALLVVLAALFCAGAGVWYWQRLERAEAPLPTPDELQQASLAPSSEFRNAEASITYYQDLVRRNPDATANYIALSQLYLQQARSTGDENRYVPLARTALENALRREPENFHALALQASLFNTLHQFEQGKAAANRLLQTYPENAYLHGVLVDATVELGQYDEAIRLADRMLAFRPDLAAYSRASYLRELHGDGPGAIAAMRMAADAGQGGRDDRAWALYHLGLLYLGEGDVQKAEFIFRGILDERPAFTRALIGLARVRLVQNQPAEAVTLLEDAYEQVPTFDALEGLAEAYAATGNTRAAAETAQKLRKSFTDALAMGENANMEYADFLADSGTPADLPGALRLAEAEHRRRPDHLHANETYAWLLHKSGRSREAVPYVERAMRMDTGDAMVHYRAARIYEATGDRAKAAEHFRRALDARLDVESVTTAAEARTALAALGAPAPAATPTAGAAAPTRR